MNVLNSHIINSAGFWLIILIINLVLQPLQPDPDRNIAVFILYAIAAIVVLQRLIQIRRIVNCGIQHIYNQLLLISAGIILFLSRFSDNFHDIIQIAAIGISLSALFSLSWGFENLRKLIFPLTTLFLIVPLLSQVDALLSFPMRKLSAQLAAFLLSTGYESIIVQGTELFSEKTRISVTAACDGLNLFQNLIWISWLYVLTNYDVNRKNYTMVMSVISAVLIANSLRIASLFVFTDIFGSEFLTSEWHIYIGWMAVALATGVFLMMDKVLLDYKSLRTESGTQKTINSKTNRVVQPADD
jgi:exosortase